MLFSTHASAFAENKPLAVVLPKTGLHTELSYVYKNCLGCISQARLWLEGIKKWYDQIVHSCIHKRKSYGKARNAPVRILEVGGDLSKSGVSNFIALIIIGAGGQQPKVLEQLLCPDARSLDKFVGLSSKRGYCEVPTAAEIAVRNMDGDIANDF